ncbi:hypothetical protein WISP_17937 [Willisornis vidua]|uniref:Uncharacterized protein n=1 Tax=Willisornis vidua TaxID=1566151 RepID=A0ABQ9DPB3_9PASS|nr:hypothetical protein WISP_17937 [Willisornis vidua]
MWFTSRQANKYNAEVGSFSLGGEKNQKERNLKIKLKCDLYHAWGFISTTQYYGTGHITCARLLPYVIHYITSFGLEVKKLEGGFGAHPEIQFSRLH